MVSCGIMSMQGPHALMLTHSNKCGISLVMWYVGGCVDGSWSWGERANVQRADQRHHMEAVGVV